MKVFFNFINLLPNGNLEEQCNLFATKGLEDHKWAFNNSNQVFIVHGHDTNAKLELARILEKEFKLDTIILHEQPNKGNTIIEKLERYSQYPGFVFVLLTLMMLVMKSMKIQIIFTSSRGLDKMLS
jgi:hypothetical protein